MKYRDATQYDSTQIAQLHTQNWQIAYRGILNDYYLDHEALQERSELWHKRLMSPAENQKVLVVEEDAKICGFVCIYGQKDPQWGSLIDNLHVNYEIQGKGIGKQLMQKAAEWVSQFYPQSGIYLWVYVILTTLFLKI